MDTTRNCFAFTEDTIEVLLKSCMQEKIRTRTSNLYPKLVMNYTQHLKEYEKHVYSCAEKYFVDQISKENDGKQLAKKWCWNQLNS